MTIAIGETQEITIEKLVYGGEGLGRVDGHTVFVDGAAPGDRLMVRIVSLERSLARAVIDRIIEPASSRREAPCGHFRDCGGCELQHLEYESQLKVKAGFIQESLRRLGGVTWDREIIVHSGPEFGYRSRAELKLARLGHRGATEQPKIGFFKAGSHEICEVADCPVLVPELNDELKKLRETADSIALEATRVFLTAGDGGVLVTPATGENSRQAEIDAMGTVSEMVAGKRFLFGVRTFWQSNRYLIGKLVAVALDGAEGKVAYDLYAGAGLFSLPLADRFEKVYSIEGSPISSKHAIENGQLNGLTNIDFVKASIEGWLKYTAPGVPAPDYVLLDPPRTGAGAPVISRLIALRPRNVTYVSCDPPTLARDLKQLIGGGYELKSVVGVDMFPQTYHIETVAKLQFG